MANSESNSGVKADEGFAEGDLGVRDSLAKDAVEAHRAQGSMPPVEEINAYLAGILDRMDRKESEKGPTVGAKKEGATEKEYNRRGGTPDSFDEWTVERKPTTLVAEPPSDTMYAEYWRRIQLRLREIARRPEWRDRVQDAIGNPHALMGQLGQLEQKRCLDRVRAIIYEYQVKYGSALKRKPERLWFS